MLNELYMWPIKKIMKNKYPPQRHVRDSAYSQGSGGNPEESLFYNDGI